MDNKLVDKEIKKPDYKVADVNLSDFGLREISIAEAEMPGLMAFEVNIDTKPLKVQESQVVFTTVQTAVLIETLVD